MNEHDSFPKSSTSVRMQLVLLLVVMSIVASQLSFGQTSTSHTSHEVRDDQARRQVLATDDRRTEALRRGDSAPLHQIYADDYTLVTPATGVIRSKAEQINDLVSGRVRYEKIEVRERTIRVYGDVA
jgi:hypothetical protein